MIWPFATRDDGPSLGRDGSGQWRRIDQGQDLQAGIGTPVLAVADGTITYASDPTGFGAPYPVLVLDTPDQRGSAVYYGHQHPEVGAGTRVRTGDVIAHAAQTPGGNASGLPGWLELGWWRQGPTGDGQAMHDALLTAGVWQPAPTPHKKGEEHMAIVVTADGRVHIERASPDGHLLYFTAAPGGHFSVIDVTDQIAADAPDHKMYTVAVP